ncbi:hypothetical protein OE104_14070 [Fervidibacillus albus]|uniref:Uncharacterized protein n=1 Tax=Fervidibacillus albus TaxID=2980026 RepID=A0A9E8RXP3_9BACI|nr:hypothetical protein [Fervidibacillus albus]WAA11373.1 hypothetical protein OE104_14070 [Fervidibacillus albus]
MYIPNISLIKDKFPKAQVIFDKLPKTTIF